MARPYWSGQLQISLVSFGVKLFVATEAKSEIHFHQISRSTGERVRYQKVQASAAEQQESTGADTPAEARVTKNDIVKGYEYEKGRYVTIEPEELEHLRVPSKHTISLDEFVNISELPPAFLEKPYFITPDSDAQTEAFATVREALRKAKKVGLGKIAFGGREHILAVAPTEGEGGGLMGFTLRYRDELRDPKEFFGSIKQVSINEESLDLATELIKRKTRKFDPSTFVDAYEQAVKELVEAKVQHAPVPTDEEDARPARGKVVNLMDALRRSVGGGEGTATVKEPATPARSKAAPAAKSTGGLSLVNSKAKKAAKPAATKAAAKPATKRRSA